MKYGAPPPGPIRRWPAAPVKPWPRQLVTDRRHYHSLWNNTGEGDECAVFSPQAGAWQFSTLRGPRERALH